MSTPTNMGTVTESLIVVAERAAFEAWYTQHDASAAMAARVVARSASGAYVLMQVHQAWLVWQARAELAARESAALSEALAQLEAERARNAADELDAARWRGLLGCARIRPLGSAGLENPAPGVYAHMGLEVWTTFSRNYSPKLLADLDIENERGRRWLTRLADVAIEAQALAIMPGAKP